MKTASLCLAAVCLLSTTANAALYDRGGGLIYDSDLNITWLQDAWTEAAYSYPNAEMDINEATIFVANLSYYDNVRNVTYSDWRLPTGDTCVGICYGGEMAHLYYNELGGTTYGGINNSLNYNPLNNGILFKNLFNNWYLTSTVHATNSGIHMIFAMGSGIQDSAYDGIRLPALIVRDGDVAAVPIPTAAWLLSSGLLGLIGLARRQRK